MNGALLTATPEPADMRYLAAVDFAGEFDAGTIVGINKAAFAAAAEAEGITLADYLANNLPTGVHADRTPRLLAKTEYVAYAYGIDDEGNATTDIATQKFTTLPAEPGEKSGCTFDIITVNPTDKSFDLTFVPSDESIYYYCTMTDKAGVDAMSGDWNTYFYNYVASRILENLTIEDVVQVLCNQGRYSTRAKNLEPSTTYYAVAVGMDLQGLLITEPKVEAITTLASYEEDYGFTSAVDEIKWNSAKVTMTPNDPTAFFYWNTMTTQEYDDLQGDEAKIAAYFTKKLDAQRIEQWGEYADMLYPLPDYIYDQCSDKEDTYTFTTLTSATTYYVYAFWVNSESGEKSSATYFSEPFTTPERPVSNAAATAALWLTDGDDWAGLDPTGFGHFAGKAILGARLQPNADAAHWYSDIFAASELDKFSDEAFISRLLKGYFVDKTSYYASYGVDWGGEYVIVSVATDADGNPGELHKLRFTADKSAAEPLTEIPTE